MKSLKGVRSRRELCRGYLRYQIEKVVVGGVVTCALTVAHNQ